MNLIHFSYGVLMLEEVKSILKSDVNTTILKNNATQVLKYDTVMDYFRLTV